MYPVEEASTPLGAQGGGAREGESLGWRGSLGGLVENAIFSGIKVETTRWKPTDKAFAFEAPKKAFRISICMCLLSLCLLDCSRLLSCPAPLNMHQTWETPISKHKTTGVLGQGP